jgi:hypothetical protein
MRNAFISFVSTTIAGPTNTPFFETHRGFHKGGTPNGWFIVYFMENPNLKWMTRGTPIYRKLSNGNAFLNLGVA